MIIDSWIQINTEEENITDLKMRKHSPVFFHGAPPSQNRALPRHSMYSLSSRRSYLSEETIESPQLNKYIRYHMCLSSDIMQWQSSSILPTTDVIDSGKNKGGFREEVKVVMKELEIRDM